MASHTKKEETGRPGFPRPAERVLFSRRSAALCTALEAGLPAQASPSVFTFPDCSSGISKTGSSITAAAPLGICTPLPCSAASRRHPKSYSVTATGYHKSPAPSREASPFSGRDKKASRQSYLLAFVFSGDFYFSTFSTKRLSIAAACARFASPLGISRPLASPRSSPAPTAQFIALTA